MATASVYAGSVRVGADGRLRCGWVGADPEYERYHDEEWSFPLHGDRELFEKLSLEAFQSGLSWITILKRRERFRSAFANFSPDIVAQFTEDKVEELMKNSGIIRNRAKVLATIKNAQITVQLIENDSGALDRLIWGFAPDASHEQRRLRPVNLDELPSQTAESAALSDALRQLGYRFVGPTTSYALMQSAGLVDDHLTDCWRSNVDSLTTRSSTPASAPPPAPSSSRMP